MDSSYNGKPEGKKPLGRPRCRWELVLKWLFVDWTYVTEVRGK
jgi:hypothetical protein